MVPRNIEEILLANFTLEELLELNDITEEEVVELLHKQGWLSEPENLIREFEDEDD